MGSASEIKNALGILRKEKYIYYIVFRFILVQICRSKENE